MIVLKLMDSLERELEDTICRNYTTEPFDCMLNDEYREFADYNLNRHAKVKGYDYQTIDYLKNQTEFTLEVFGFTG